MSGEKNDAKLFITKLKRFYKETSGFVDWPNAGFAIKNLMFMFTLVVDLYKNGERTEVDFSMLDEINKEYVKLFKQISPQTINRVNGDDDTSSCFHYPANSPFSKQNKSVSKEELKKDTSDFFNFFKNSIYEDLKNKGDEISEEEKNENDSIFVFEVDVEETKLVSFSTSNSMGTVSNPVLVSLTKRIKGQRDVKAKFLDTPPRDGSELEFFDSNESSLFFLFENFARSLLYFHVFYRNLYTKMFYNSCKKISEAFEPTDELEQGKVLMQLLLEKSCKSSVNNLQIERFPFAKNAEGHFFLETMAYSILMAFRIIEIGGTTIDPLNKFSNAVNQLRVGFFQKSQKRPFLKNLRTYFEKRYNDDKSLQALPALSDY